MTQVLLSSAERYETGQFSEQSTPSSQPSQMIAQVLETITTLERTGFQLRNPKLSKFKMHTAFDLEFSPLESYLPDQIWIQTEIYMDVLFMSSKGQKYTKCASLAEGKYIKVFLASGISISHFVSGVKPWVILSAGEYLAMSVKIFHCHDKGNGVGVLTSRGQRSVILLNSSNTYKSPPQHSIIWPKMSRVLI